MESVKLYASNGRYIIFEKGYNRNLTYPKIGFTKSLFIEDMPDYKLINTIYFCAE